MSMMSANRPATTAWRLTLTLTAACFVSVHCGDLFAQRKAHYLFDTRQPAGEIGRMQLARRPDLLGVNQPVLLKVPAGAEVSVAEGAGFPVAERDAALVSLLVGETYRLKVSGIPNRHGDVYPTVELLDRMHAPPGKETRYPIPIELTAADLGLALSGKYVTRVIYVEDPHRALPARDLPQQRYLDAMAHEDPLHVADSFGRPVAILRMGSLAPGTNGPSTGFLFGAPPFQRHAVTPSAPYRPSELKPGDLPPKLVPGEPAPRVPNAQDGQVEPGTATPQADATLDPQAEVSPNDQPDATREADPFETPEATTPDDEKGDLFDEPTEPSKDAPSDEDPFADDN